LRKTQHTQLILHIFILGGREECKKTVYSWITLYLVFVQTGYRVRLSIIAIPVTDTCLPTKLCRSTGTCISGTLTGLYACNPYCRESTHFTRAIKKTASGLSLHYVWF